MILSIRNFTRTKINKSFLEKVTRPALKKIGIKEKAEISLVFVGDKRIRTLNKKYRKVNRVTDVLAFGEKTKGKFIKAPDKVRRLGEIIICYPQAKRQAKEKGHSIKKELTTLLVHGILNLVK